MRARAAEFGIDPSRIGILGFSAGGELAAVVAYGEFAGDPAAPISISTSTPVRWAFLSVS